MSVSKKMRFEVFKRDKFICQYCGERSPNVILEIDHVKPISKGARSLEEFKNKIYDYIEG